MNLNPHSWMCLTIGLFDWCARCGVIRAVTVAESRYWIPQPTRTYVDPLVLFEEPSCKTPVVSQMLVERYGEVHTLFEFFNPTTKETSFTQVADGDLFTIGVQSTPAAPPSESNIDF